MDASLECQEPDESRPAKRTRLDAPLHVTEDVQEEIVDDDDWDNIYNDDDEPPPPPNVVESAIAAASEQSVSAVPPEALSTSDPPIQSIVEPQPQPQPIGTLNLAPARERISNTGDRAVEAETQQQDGILAEAIDDGYDFVDEQHHNVAKTNEPDVRMVEELSAVNGNEAPVLDGLAAVSNQEENPWQISTVAEQDAQMTEETAPVDGNDISGPESAQQHVEMVEGIAAVNVDGNSILDGFEKELSQEQPSADADERVGSLSALLEESTVAPQLKTTEDADFIAAAVEQKVNKVAEWQFDSSDAESSSDSDSDSDSHSSDDSDGGYEMLDAATAAKILMSGDGEDDDDKGKKGNDDRQPRTANEVKETVIPKPDVTITEDTMITELGYVQGAVENMVLIVGSTPGEYQVLESGSVLCNEKRQVVGAVLETFGKVQAPMYSVAFTNTQEVENAGLVYGAKVFYVDEHSKFVFTQPLKNLKGTDASNIHDEEVGEDEIEFSDDEQEAEYKRQKKMAKKAARGGMGAQSARGGRGNFGGPGHVGGNTYMNASDAPQQTYGGGMSYDDEPTEDFYSPLKRPDNLSEVMASGGPLPPRPQGGNFDRGRGGRGRGDRGRGRGDRGGRGRGDRGRGRGGFDTQRGGGRGRGRGDSDNQRGGGRGGHGRSDSNQANGHKGNAQSFPDPHNNERPPAAALKPHALPPKPSVPQTSPSAVTQPLPPQQYAPPTQYQAPAPSTYQFNGYTFQHGITAAQQQQQQQQQQQPQQQQQSYYIQQPAAAASTQPAMSAGTYVNPAFYQAQQASQQAQWAQQPAASQAQHLNAYPPWPGQQQRQYSQVGAAAPPAHGYGGITPPTLQQQNNLADILRRLGGQQ